MKHKLYSNILCSIMMIMIATQVTSITTLAASLPTTQAMTISVNGKYNPSTNTLTGGKKYEGFLLTDTIKKAESDGLDIHSIKIEEGDFITTDWNKLHDIPSLSRLEIADVSTVTVAPIPTPTATDYWFPTHIISVNISQLETVPNTLFPDNITLEAVTFPDAKTIDQDAFSDCIGLTHVDFPNVLAVPPNAFTNLTALATIDFDSATTIGYRAFGGCTGLTTASFDSMLSVPSDAFKGLKSLKNVVFPKATTIGEDAFTGCTALATVELPNVGSIPANAFANLDSLVTIDFASAKTIGKEAFEGCSSLATAYFPNVTSVSVDSFKDCDALVTANFPRLTTAPPDMFKDLSKLTTVHFLSLTKLNTDVFTGCTALTKVSIPSLTKIPDGTFADCANLSSIGLGAKPPVITHKSILGTASNKSIDFITNVGKQLTGTSLRKAHDAYQEVSSDSSEDDNYWYGWQIDPDAKETAHEVTLSDAIIVSNQGKKEGSFIAGQLVSIQAKDLVGFEKWLTDGTIPSDNMLSNTSDSTLHFIMPDEDVTASTRHLTTSLTGTIEDTDDEPIQGAKVTLSIVAYTTVSDDHKLDVKPAQNKLTTTTNSTGKYTFEDIPIGYYQMTVTTDTNTTTHLAQVKNPTPKTKIRPLDITIATNVNTTIISPKDLPIVTGNLGNLIPTATLADNDDATFGVTLTVKEEKNFKNQSDFTNHSLAEEDTIGLILDVGYTKTASGGDITAVKNQPITIPNTSPTISFKLPKHMEDSEITAYYIKTNGSFSSGVTLPVTRDNIVNIATPFNTTYILTYEQPHIFTTNMGNDMTSESYGAGHEIQLNAGENPGYLFDKWVSSNGGTFGDEKLEKTTFTTPNNDTTITATWRQNNCVLTVNLNNGSGSTVTGTHPPLSSVTIDAGTRNGYEFVGWTSSNGGVFGHVTAPTTTFTMPNESTTITANWDIVSSSNSVSHSDMWNNDYISASQVIEDIENSKKMIGVDINDATYMSTTVFQTLKKYKEKELVLTDDQYQWKFVGKDITNNINSAYFNSDIIFSSPNMKDIRSSAGTTDLMCLSFGGKESLPGKASITVEVRASYHDKVLNVYHYNQDKSTFELIAKGITPDQGTITFDIDRCTDIVITTTTIR